MIECKALDNFYDSTKSEEETEKKTEGITKKRAKRLEGKYKELGTILL